MKGLMGRSNLKGDKMIFSKLSLSKKLLIAPLIVVLFLIVLSYVSYRSLSNQKVAMDNIYHARFKSYQDTSRLIKELLSIHSNVYRVISWTDARYDSQKIDHLAKDQIKALEEILGFSKSILSSNTLTPEEKKAYQAILENLMPYNKAAKAVLDMVRLDTNVATMQMGTADDYYQVLEKKLQGLLELETRLSQEQYDNSSQSLSSVLKTFLVVLVVAVALSLLVSFLISGRITLPVRMAVNFAQKMSEGDLTQTLEISQKDEIGVLAGALNKMGSSFKKMFRIQDIVTGVQTLFASSTELSALSTQMSRSAEQTSAKAHTVAAASEEMSTNMASVSTAMEKASTNLLSVASATEEMSATIGEVASNSEKARVISEQATAQAQVISTMMQQLGEAAREIGKVTETITDISSQTNLLALNATIEAARAGAAGKGFAVVANEIKELARQTAAATEDIKAKIAGVQTSTGGAIADIEKITGVIKEVGSIVAAIAAAIEEQATMTKDVASNIAYASTGVKDANERVAQTASVSKNIAQDITGVNSAVADIRQGGERVQLSAAELSKLAEQLKTLVGQFKI
jgi:methyl-accepting chemotaxis protein